MARLRDARPPRMCSFPCHLPDCLDIGARPARLAACLFSSAPSSGMSMSRANAVASPIPGMLIRISQALCQCRILSYSCCDVGINFSKLSVDQRETFLALVLQHCVTGDGNPVPCGAPVLDQTRACDMQLPEFVKRFAPRHTGREFESGPHPYQQIRIHPVGLGMCAGGLGEAAGLTRIDLDERVARLCPHRFHGPMIRTCRFKTMRRSVAGPIHFNSDLNPALSLSKNACRRPESRNVSSRSFEMSMTSCSVLSLPLLVIRALTPCYPFRAEEKTGAIMLRLGVPAPGFPRSDPRRRPA